MPHRNPFRGPAGSTVITVVVTGYYVLLDSGREEAADGRSRAVTRSCARSHVVPPAVYLSAVFTDFTESHPRTTSNIPYDVWKMHLQSTSFVQQSTLMTCQGVALVSTV